LTTITRDYFKGFTRRKFNLHYFTYIKERLSWNQEIEGAMPVLALVYNKATDVELMTPKNVTPGVPIVASITWTI
jgi:hypothetical protein